MKTLIIHLGPHKTGSTSIQRFLREHLAEPGISGDNPVYYNGSPVGDLARAFGSKDWDAALDAVRMLSKSLDRVNSGKIIISNEDLSGGLVGRSATRRIYPRLFAQLRLIEETLQDRFKIYYYFVLRDEREWLRSVYNQNLKHRQSATSFEAFADWVRGPQSWDQILQKPRAKLQDRFIEIPYSSDRKDNIVARFQRSALPDLAISDDALIGYWDNKAPDLASLAILEIINGAHASRYARQLARKFITASEKPQSNVRGFSEAQSQFRPGPDADALKQDAHPKGPVWPPVHRGDLEMPKALSALWQRAENRVRTEEQPNLMPDPSAGFDEMRKKITSGEDVFPGPGREDMHHQVRILKYRFRGLPIVCFHNALAISYLRRDTAHNAHARAVFHTLWENEYPLLLGTLPTRWLISTLQTFVDHGQNEHQRQIGTAGYFFSNTMKAYEAERALEGLQPDAKYPNVKPATKNGFAGMDRFNLGNTDLMLNMMAMLLETSAREEVAGRVLREFILRSKTAKTLFSRMDQNRLAHNANIKGFLNCWSYFEPPSSVQNL